MNVPDDPAHRGAAVCIELDTALYRSSAIKKAAYKFGDRCHVLIEPVDGGTRVKVSLRPKRLLDSPQYLLGEFQNEVLDQELREVVAAETEGVRNVIIAAAFSATNLLDPQGEQADFHDDPLRIREPDRTNAKASEELAGR
jgi:His-Xaa-Ser system protein HxsD